MIKRIDHRFNYRCGSVDRYISTTHNDRKAKCDHCGYLTNSDKELPMFNPRPDLGFDYFYCGCFGFD